MKTSIVISMKKIWKVTGFFFLCVIFLIVTIKGNLPGRLFRAMTKELITAPHDTLFNPKSVFSLGLMQTVYAQMPTPPKEIEQKPTPAELVPLSTPAPSPDAVPASRDFSNQKSEATVQNIIIKNHAGKSFQTEELLKKPLPYDATTGGYKVLVVHTHTTESYFPTDRSNDETKNMIQVGKEFSAVLEQNGIKTLHITKVHDVPYTTSYKKSLESVTAALAEHPTIEVVIDLHRDALYNEAGEKVKPLATINGEAAAQVMLVTGTEQGGLPHPNWADNLAFAVKVQRELLTHYPNLARPVDLRKERFNTHTTKNSVIFEIGANGNTLSEAIAGAKLAAQSVANVLNKN